MDSLYQDFHTFWNNLPRKSQIHSAALVYLNSCHFFADLINWFSSQTSGGKKVNYRNHTCQHFMPIFLLLVMLLNKESKLAVSLRLIEYAVMHFQWSPFSCSTLTLLYFQPLNPDVGRFFLEQQVTHKALQTTLGWWIEYPFMFYTLSIMQFTFEHIDK